MILSAHEIERRLHAEDGFIIAPYNPACQQPASYDLRIGEDCILTCGKSTLVHSLEHVELPKDLAGTLRCRSSFARRGVLVGGGFVDPGFRGQLTLCLVNLGKEDVILGRGDRVVQMVLSEVKGGESLYGGKYQDSTGVVGVL